ncbi:MAG: hypothetical protein WCF79_08645 [Rhodomicrobium sp.]
MSSDIRCFVTALSPEGLSLLFQHADLPRIEFDGLGRRERTKQTIEAVLRAPTDTRVRVEAIAHSVGALADKRDLAERALREVCQACDELLAVLEKALSLEERIFTVWLSNPKVLDRARNLAQGYHWRNSRYHCGFLVKKPQPLVNDVQIAKEVIGRIVQEAQGGRKVSLDHFSYADEEGAGQLIHHIAVYLETPASVLLEFKDGENHPEPVVRREAREVAIDYNLQTGQIDVAGKGIGGSKLLMKVAKAFCETALAEAEPTQIIRPEWTLKPFMSGIPTNLMPPPGYAGVRISEIITLSASVPGSRLQIRAGKSEDVYERARNLGLSLRSLAQETVHSVTMALTAIPTSNESEPRELRVILTWPNARSVDGGLSSDQEVIEAWLRRPPFLPPK